jgi:hypothetical protein
VFFSLERYFLARILCQKTGGICSHPKLAGIIRSVRPVGLTGQTGVVKVHKIPFGSPLDRSCRVDQNPYMERPNRSLDERDMTSPKSTRWAHRSDRSP